MTLAEYRNRLLVLPFVSELPEPMRARVCMTFLWIGQPVSFSPEDCIFVQGDDDEHTGCVLLRGDAIVSRDDEDAVLVSAPELLGEMQQLEPTGQRTATVRVVKDAETLLFSWHDFIAYSGQLLTADEQIVLREVLRSTAAQRRAT